MCRVFSSLPPTSQCRGNAYSELTRDQQSDFYEELLRRCHSLETLRRERVILDNGPLPLSIAKKPGLGIENFVATPKRDPTIRKRKAVALDCEWGKGQDHRNELLSICTVDFLTGRRLINSLVAPSQPILEWRSHIHGINAETIEAVTGGYKCLRGWEEARTKLFEYVDDETILVGHRIRNDLELLRIFHNVIVDSQVLAADAVFKNAKKRPGYKWPIDKVCEGFLGITIHQNDTSTNQVYSSLENVLASREIVLQCIQRPRDLEEWGKRERGDFWKPKDRKRAIKAAASTADRKYDSAAVSAADQKADGKAGQQSQLSGHIPGRNEHPSPDSNAFIAGYQTAYQTAFQKGFQIGYERGSQEVTLEMNRTWKNFKNQGRFRYANQRNSWKDDRDADEKGVLDHRSIRFGRNDLQTLNHATKKRDHPFQSSKKIHTEDMARIANQNGDENAMSKTDRIKNWLANMPRSYVDKEEEENVILESNKTPNTKEQDMGKAQKKSSMKTSKKARRKARRKAKKEAKEKQEMKFNECADRKMKKGAERKVITDLPPRDTQTATWSFEDAVQEEQESESVVGGLDVIIWMSEISV